MGANYLYIIYKNKNELGITWENDPNLQDNQVPLYVEKHLLQCEPSREIYWYHHLDIQPNLHIVLLFNQLIVQEKKTL